MQKTASSTPAQLWRVARLCREQFERIRFLFELIGAVIVGIYVMGLLMYVVHRGYPL